DSFVVGRIRGVANANQIAFRRKEAAAAATVGRLADSRIIGPAFVFVDSGDSRRSHGGIGALVAADGEGVVTGSDGSSRRRDVDGASAWGADTDQSHVAVEVVADELTSGGLCGAIGEDVGGDFALAF